MSIPTRIFSIICVVTAVLAFSVTDSQSVTRDGLGLRLGMNMEPDQFLIGGQGEFGPVIGPSFLVPSLDFGIADATTVTANLDLRWYLLPLPETGLYFYGSAGPTVVLSPDTEVGLSLTAGVHIPMRNYRRYNLEVRFGFGDIPDFTIVGALVFGL